MFSESHSSLCPPAVVQDCSPSHCRPLCALSVIDGLLGLRAGLLGEEVDRLLDLRWLLRKGDEAEAVLRVFCDLRLRMEQRHYLAFFRLRRWLENHLEAAVRICPAAEPILVSVSLSHYCVEAIRRVALCAALGRGGVMLAPRLEFRLRTPHARISQAASAAASA